MSDSLWPHGLQHDRPPCPSPTTGVYSNSCALSQWCHPTTSSSVILFSSCLQSFPASGSFSVNQFFTSIQFSSSVMSDSLWPHVLQHTGQVSLSFAISLSLLKLKYFELVMPSNHLIFFYPLLLLPSIFPSISVFSSESVLHIRWPKYWSFSFSISLSSEYSGLISFRIDQIDLLAVHGSLKNLL